MSKKRLTVAAGWSTAAIGVLHTLVFLPHPYWSEWLGGGLRSGEGGDASLSVFWALPGGFVVPLVLLGLLVARLGRRGGRVPAYVGWGLGLWAAGCALLIGPSGFLLGLVPAGLLIAEDLAARRGGAGRGEGERTGDPEEDAAPGHR
ncbi:hypothetical protein SAMN05421803_101816 [Nocardiopsis flavescens]|uniref:Uncharacterized protein n=1 Tax=Nocardiopsis flavescens TaxID=758803 RepID=A0A1M6CUM8_9ACTN|nr:DUF6463 family protein [Nocardiopsis flavescens]SHI64448.1 hypothetical protein SAMN05421803_101816 [Nocardiopsis flavescens]